MRGSHWGMNVPSILLSIGLFHLNAIDTVDAVNEEDEDEDEGNLDFVSE